jgi:mRNA-degrading endonuclease RelE of RelBE toxin-antitoxin system
LRVILSRIARLQLAALPAPGAQRVVEALRLLQAAPPSGPAYPDDSPFRGDRYKTVMVRARRWTYRITYTVRRDELRVRYIYPSWYPLTHPGLAEPADD